MILLIIKFYLIMIEICKISYSCKIFVSFPLRTQSRAPSTLSHPCHPLAPRLVSQICFGRFLRHRDEAPPPAPWSEVQGVPCSRSNGGSSSTSTEARRPVLLVEMILKVESEVFAQWSNATKGSSYRKVILVSHGRREEEFCLEEHSFSCQKLCEAAGGRH